MPSTIRHQYAGPILGAKSCTWPSRSSAGACDGSADSSSRCHPERSEESHTRDSSASPRNDSIPPVSAVSQAAESSLSAPRPRPWRALALRVASGVVLVPFLLGVAYPGGPGYGLLIAFASGIAAFEMRQMLRAGGYRPLTAVLVGVSVLLPLDAWLRPSNDPTSVAPDGLVIIEIAVILSLVALLVRSSMEHALV